MKIVARIEKLAADQYRYNGRTFDSFLGARRERLNETRERRTKTRARHSAEFGCCRQPEQARKLSQSLVPRRLRAAKRSIRQ